MGGESQHSSGTQRVLGEAADIVHVSRKVERQHGGDVYMKHVNSKAHK